MPLPSRGTALIAAGALALVPVLLTSSPSLVAAAPAAAAAALTCPVGSVASTRSAGLLGQEEAFADPAYSDLVSAANTASPAYCRTLTGPEKFAELRAMADEAAVITAGPTGSTPVGGLRAGVAQQERLEANAAGVAGAAGTFTKVGTTPLITDGPDSPGVNGLGLADQGGRVDSYAFDSVHRRLFSAPGTGGVWMSSDIGKSWTSIGDGLPYQSIGAVTWSKAGNAATGTLLAVSGAANGGGDVYTGLGAFYSPDLGKTWLQSKGIRDGLMGFEIEVDPSNPTIVYAATSQGLYRSTDTGKTYTNVKLPTGSCAGKTSYNDVCQNANWVTDVEVQTPGGTTGVKGGRVLAAVGYRAGRLNYPGTTTPQSPANGLYRSESGAPGTFTMLDISGDGQTPVGFAPQERIGRFEMGHATGGSQNHDFVYALVQDAVLFNGGVIGLDAIDNTTVTGATVPHTTILNGIYVSGDFGSSWTRMADELELQNPATGSALNGYFSTAGMYAPGVQAFYNQWIAPDPTRQTEAGVPTRLVFGLEEVWESRLPNTAQDGVTQAADPLSFEVIGPYFAGDSCFGGLGGNPLPICPTTQNPTGATTTHPDQQTGIWIPEPDNSGVTLVLGNDGGTYTQKVAAGAELARTWGRGSQTGYNTLLPYDASPAKDGTVAIGLQDNGSGHITKAGKIVGTFGGDGFFAAIDPDNSKIQYSETTLGAMVVTTDGGLNYTAIDPGGSAPLFSNPFQMDPTDAGHLITGGPEVFERTRGPGGSWTQVFNLDDTAGDPHQVTAVELYGAAAYVSYCQICDIINKQPTQVFKSGIATNVGGSGAPAKGSTSGWHIAPAKGLPDRYVTNIAIDPKNPKTVYVTLSGYANRQWWPVGAFNDKNPNVGEGHVFKSTDGGNTFTNISGTLPDLPARSIEVVGDQLVVGMDTGLFLSSDTRGSQWAALKGLPRVPVLSVKNWPGKARTVVLATFGRGVYSYALGGAGSTVVTPTTPTTTPRPASGNLATTGLPAAGTGLALLLLTSALLVRRRRTA